MFGFIKNWFKPKRFKEVKQEYRQAKVNWITRTEECKEAQELFKAYKIVDEIGLVSIRDDQEECPSVIVYRLEQLYKLGIEEAIKNAVNMLDWRLPESQKQDLINKIKQNKEYKEWKLNKKMNKLQEDFND